MRCRSLLLGLLALLPACGVPDPPPMITQIGMVLYRYDGGLDLTLPDQPVTVVIDAVVPQGVTLEGLRLEKSWNGTAFVLHEQYSQWPLSKAFTLAQLLDNWPDVSPDQIRKGDVISLRLIPVNSNDYQAADPLELSLTCLSALAGPYEAKTIGRAGPGGGGDFDTLTSQVTLTKLTAGRYELSDLSGGMYPQIWGGEPQAGILTDSCRILSIPAQADQWKDQISGTGSVLPDGRLYLQWQNSYGDQGETWLSAQ